LLRIHSKAYGYSINNGGLSTHDQATKKRAVVGGRLFAYAFMARKLAKLMVNQ
jgi:hypothetical protein